MPLRKGAEHTENIDQESCVRYKNYPH
jgi:Protein of unknown function (DUF3489)